METSASLLERLRAGSDETAWRQLDELYRPLIRRWLLRDPSLRDEAEDIVQDVMAVLVRELPQFERCRTGSFRRWLRGVTAHRLLAHQRSRHNRPHALDTSVEQSTPAQLADPSSELSRQWDEEHDRFVLRRLFQERTSKSSRPTRACHHRLKAPRGASGAKRRRRGVLRCPVGYGTRCLPVAAVASRILGLKLPQSRRVCLPHVCQVLGFEFG